MLLAPKAHRVTGGNPSQSVDLYCRYRVEVLVPGRGAQIGAVFLDGDSGCLNPGYQFGSGPDISAASIH